MSLNLYPGGQVSTGVLTHMYEPMVFWQALLLPQLATFSIHSSISKKNTWITLNHLYKIYIKHLPYMNVWQHLSFITSHEQFVTSQAGSDKSPQLKDWGRDTVLPGKAYSIAYVAATKKFRSRVKGSLVEQNRRNLETACSTETTFTTPFHTATQDWTWSSRVSSLLFQVLYGQERSPSIKKTGCFEKHMTFTSITKYLSSTFWFYLILILISWLLLLFHYIEQ